MSIWATGISAAVGVGTSIYSANEKKKAAKSAAEATKPDPYNVNSPYGNVFFDPTSGQMSFQQFDNPWYNMFGAGGMAALGNAFTAPGSPYYGASPELVAAAEGMKTENLQQDAMDRYQLLGQLAQPEMDRSYNNLQDKLYAQGRLGNTGGGVELEAWQNAANRADLERQLAAQGWSENRAQNRFATALQAINQGQSAQQQNYGIGAGSMGAQNNLWANLFNTANLGITAGGGVAGPAAAAMMEYGGSPLAAGIASLENSGAFDKFGQWAGNKIGGWFG